MKKKEETVVLFHPLKGERVFTKEHADNLLAIPERIRGGWELAAQKPADNVVDDSTNKGSDQKRGRRKVDDKQGD